MTGSEVSKERNIVLVMRGGSSREHVSCLPRENHLRATTADTGDGLSRQHTRKSGNRPAILPTHQNITRAASVCIRRPDLSLGPRSDNTGSSDEGDTPVNFARPTFARATKEGGPWKAIAAAFDKKIVVLTRKCPNFLHLIRAEGRLCF